MAMARVFPRYLRAQRAVWRGLGRVGEVAGLPPPPRALAARLPPPAAVVGPRRGKGGAAVRARPRACLMVVAWVVRASRQWTPRRIRGGPVVMMPCPPHGTTCCLCLWSSPSPRRHGERATDAPPRPPARPPLASPLFFASAGRGARFGLGISRALSGLSSASGRHIFYYNAFRPLAPAVSLSVKHHWCAGVVCVLFAAGRRARAASRCAALPPPSFKRAAIDRI
jgi:hypothetical protein